MGEKKYIPEMIAENMGRYYEHGLQEIFDAGLEIQDKVLADIIELSQESQYAKDHGFASITSKEEFRAQVPVSEYGDVVSYIEANMKNDDHQVTIQPTDHYLLSTGKEKQRGKYYIETKLGALARQLSIDLWNMNLTKLEPKMTQPDVKMLAVTNCSPLENAPNGKAVRRTSGQAAKELWEKNPELYVFPYEFLEAEMTDDARDYLTALYVLKERGFNMLFCNNLGYFGVLIDQIDAHATQMIADIRTGTMSVSLQEKDRTILEAGFTADEDRADELQRILDNRGKLILSQVWPNFCFTGAWLAGTVGDYAKDVMRRLPKTMRYLSESYGCSEAMINLPLDYDAKYGPLAVYSCYFEFLPLTGGSLLSMAEVEDGAYYELVVSTYSGLYRYNLHDIVRIRGFMGTTANIEFCCRSSESIQAGGRIIHGYEISDFILALEDRAQIGIDFYQVHEEDGRVALILQQAAGAHDDLTMISRKVFEWAEVENIEISTIYWVNKAYRMNLYHTLMSNGRTIQCIKLPMIARELPEETCIEQVEIVTSDVRRAV